LPLEVATGVRMAEAEAEGEEAVMEKKTVKVFDWLRQETSVSGG
jgi:hypothetical protein